MLPEACKDCIAEPEECKTCRFYGQPNIRDFLAGCALIGLRQHSVAAPNGPTAEMIANWAYQDADAMLKRREA